MNDRRVAAYAAEGVVWSRLAALLPAAEDVDEVQGCWDIGEQEAGLDLLVGQLVELGLPVGQSARTEIAVMAEQWGEGDRLGAAIVACPGEDAQPASLRVFEDGDEDVPVPRDVLPERADPSRYGRAGLGGAQVGPVAAVSEPGGCPPSRRCTPSLRSGRRWARQ